MSITFSCENDDKKLDFFFQFFIVEKRQNSNFTHTNKNQN